MKSTSLSLVLSFLLAFFTLNACSEPAPSADERVESTVDTQAEAVEEEEEYEAILATGIVLAESGLIVREQPNTEAERVDKLPQYEKVEVIGMEGPKATIEGMESRWFRVRLAEEETGWAFGGFLGISLSAPHCWCEAGKSFVSIIEDGIDEASSFSVSRGAEYAGSEKLPCYIDGAGLGLDYTSGGYKISPGGKFIAIDEGTAAMGSLYIGDLHAGKRVAELSFDRNLREWEGESYPYLSYTGKVLRSDEETGVTVGEMEEMIWENGKTRGTGKKSEAMLE